MSTHCSCAQVNDLLVKHCPDLTIAPDATFESVKETFKVTIEDFGRGLNTETNFIITGILAYPAIIHDNSIQVYIIPDPQHSKNKILTDVIRSVQRDLVSNLDNKLDAAGAFDVISVRSACLWGRSITIPFRLVLDEPQSGSGGSSANVFHRYTNSGQDIYTEGITTKALHAGAHVAVQFSTVPYQTSDDTAGPSYEIGFNFLLRKLTLIHGLCPVAGTNDSLLERRLPSIATNYPDMFPMAEKMLVELLGNLQWLRDNADDKKPLTSSSDADGPCGTGSEGGDYFGFEWNDTEVVDQDVEQ